MTDRAKILLVDDHSMIRQGLCHLLRDQADFEVVGEAADGRAAVTMAAELRPDVVVMDLSMPHLDGISATRQILAQLKTTKVVCLSALSDQKSTTEMFKAGATAYVHKEAIFDELAVAIRTVLNSSIYVSPRIAAMLVSDVISERHHSDIALCPAVSPREREVLQLIADGKSTKEVAMGLHVSIKTVETHRRNLMEKLKVDSVAELTKYAVREGISSL